MKKKIKQKKNYKSLILSHLSSLFYVQEVLGSLRVQSRVMASALSQVCVDVCDGGRKTGTVSGRRTAEPSRRVRSGHSTSSARLRADTEAPLWSPWMHFFPSLQRECWHRTPLNSCGQMQRWFWWHVPPFWHINSSSSHTFAKERDSEVRLLCQRCDYARIK